jgi:hypothetical protein
MKNMNMKLPLAFAFFAILISSLDAQEKEPATAKPFYKNEVSLDMFYFLNIFRPSFLPGPATRMAFAIEHHISQTTIIRLGSEVASLKYSTHVPFQQTLHHNDLSLLLRLGMEKEIEILPKWEILYGFDLLYKSDIKENEQGNGFAGITSDQDKSRGEGFSGIFGVKFHFAPRMSLSAETDFELWSYHGLVTSTNDLFPANNQSNKTSGMYTYYAAPENIFLNIEF